jgi:acetylornithine deacetylase/succinyl-diaminopimelate desuccinylase-like protein
MKALFISSLCLALSLPVCGFAQQDASSIARDWRKAHETEIIHDFVELLKIPNVASDEVNIRRNARHISSLLQARRFETRLLELEGSPPVVYAERLTPGADRTLMIYIHYDGQPVNPADWSSDPWDPVMRNAAVELGGEVIAMTPPFDPEWRLFGRSAGDDKGPIIALSAALDALDDRGISPSVNLKLFLEGEEEAGSPHLRKMLEKHRDLLDADLWLFCDGPVHQSRQWLLSYGVRGTFGFDLTVFGANRPLHSGHYGNWAPNPINRLNQLIATMRDESGNILVPGYHDEVIAPTLMEQQAIAAAPSVDKRLLAELGINRAETEERLEMSLMRPALNLRGIRSGDVGGQARNSIQTSASASIGLRLVPAQTPDHLRTSMEKHIRDQGYHIVYEPPSADQRAQFEKIALLKWSEAGYPAYRAPMDMPIVQKVSGMLNELSDGTLIQLPTMGGSLPLYLIDQVVGAPILILPIANHDNNQHGSDENLRLQNLWDAIEIYATVLTEL